MHPSRLLVAVGLVTGRVQVFDAGSRMSTTTAASAAGAAATAAAAAASPPLVDLRASSSSARAVAFSADGSALYVGDAEGTLTAVDVATGRASARLPGAGGGASFTRLVAALLGGGGGASPSSSPFLPATSVVSGDESGAVRVWDPRSGEPVFEFREVHGGEQVSDLLPLPAGAAAGLKSNTASSSSSGGGPAASPSTTGGLVSVGGDGTLALLDFARAGAGSGGGGARGRGASGGGGARGRGGAAASRSDADADELLCLCAARGFSALCAGSAGGVLSLWKPQAAGGLAGCADRLPLPRAAAREGAERPAINSLAPLDGGGGGGRGRRAAGGGGSLLLAGCADGRVRVLSVLPNRVLCNLGGAHGDGREVLRVRTGAGGGEEGRGDEGGEPTCSLPRVAASVAAPSKSLCLWSCKALRASAGEAAIAVAAGVGGKRARRRRAEEEGESSSGDEEEGDESDEEGDGDAVAAAPKRGKAAASRPGAGSFFDGIVS